MCGIVGYIGPRDPRQVVLDGLRKLEYRGYDSSGVAIHRGSSGIQVTRAVGPVDDLVSRLESVEVDPSARIAVGHTRWATHGAPEERNAHPHTSHWGDITLVHNGIIENYETLKRRMSAEGYEFKSDTDTEVLASWIDWTHRQLGRDGSDLVTAVRTALADVVGAYAILVMSPSCEQVVAARRSSPLAVGIGVGEIVIASDATPIIPYTREIVYLEDNEIALIDIGSLGSRVSIINMNNEPVTPKIERVEMALEQIEMGGYDSFMLKEIHEQVDTVTNCLRGRLTQGTDPLMMGGMEKVMPQLLRATKIFIVACGTSWHAGLVGKTVIERLTRIPVEVDYASEFRYRNPIIRHGDVVIAISQSGETADTKAAMELARERGATLFGIVNVVGSSIARLADSGVYTHSGVEMGVASTKAFTGQVAALTLMAAKMAYQLGSINEAEFVALKDELRAIPAKIGTILSRAEEIFSVADEYVRDEYRDFLYLGRGISFPIALEGALKLKEISYLHAEAYPAGEMKHGPIALVDANCPTVFVAPSDSSYEKVISNAQEIKARRGRVVAIVTRGDESMRRVADHVIEVEPTHDLLSPLLTVVPLQLLSYRIALKKGCNVDKPRNLAKSVTVE